MKEFSELLAIMHRLRQECPWDKEQSLESLKPFLLEEAYECLDAMSQDQNYNLQDHLDELGDVLLQVIFQSEILSESSNGNQMLSVVENLKSKLIRRHPHVFGENESTDRAANQPNSGEVLKSWEKIKEQEKNEKGIRYQSALKPLPKSFPASLVAQKLGKKAHQLQFDWKSASEVWNQVEEEFQELKEASSAPEKKEELGDLLFSLAQWARHQHIDLEVAFAEANQKFIRRFQKMENLAQNLSEDFATLSLEKKEELWKAVKKDEQSKDS